MAGPEGGAEPMARRDLLVEVGTEELPPRALRRLAEALARSWRAGLEKAGAPFGEVVPYATPRRLALLVRDLACVVPGGIQERRGPALRAAFDEAGRPTKAALGFARSCGVAVEDLERLETVKGSWLMYRSRLPDRPVQEILPGLLASSLSSLPVPKRMRWGSLKESFVRPVHWLVLLFEDEVVPASLFGLETGRSTRGHRFHCPRPLALAAPADYATVLEREGKVVVDLDTRRASIRRQVEAAAREAGGRAVIDEDLLEEVAGMVEWPVALAGSFEERFLAVPPEALISAMKAHQKYFHVVDDSGALLPRFVAVSNIESRDPDVVRAGNERVIRPRLADAAFFWQQDRSRTLASRIPELDQVVFQERLGTLRDKCERLARLAVHIAAELQGNSSWAERAALLAKCDLLTAMVGEFPELQGIMGRYYAGHDGEAEEVAQALDEQYLPRFAGDRLPRSPTGQALALADRLDTLVGIFGIGLVPSGDKDPFGLRRAALGVLRILVERRLDLDLIPLLEAAKDGYRQRNGLRFDAGLVERVFDFMLERLRGYCLERGTAPDTFAAVLARCPSRPLDFYLRLEAVESFRDLPEAHSLAAAHKRIRNLLRKAQTEIQIEIPEQLDTGLLREPAEQELAAALSDLETVVSPLLARREYAAALQRLAALARPVDRFFDEVMVMVDDPALRDNRLALLDRLRAVFLQVADLSHLQMAGD